MPRAGSTWRRSALVGVTHDRRTGFERLACYDPETGRRSAITGPERKPTLVPRPRRARPSVRPKPPSVELRRPRRGCAEAETQRAETEAPRPAGRRPRPGSASWRPSSSDRDGRGRWGRRCIERRHDRFQPRDLTAYRRRRLRDDDTPIGPGLHASPAVPSSPVGPRDRGRGPGHRIARVWPDREGPAGRRAQSRSSSSLTARASTAGRRPTCPGRARSRWRMARSS